MFPGEEDFGMVPVEVMAAGRPVIAYGKGGALDTVVEGTSGTLFQEQSVDALIDAIERFEQHSLDQDTLQAHAAQFGIDQFKSKISDLLAANRIQV